MKILVTGGAGYLGSVLVEDLLSSGHSIRVLDKFIHGFNPLDEIADPNLQVNHGDKCKDSVLAEAVRDVDVVVDLAALVGNKICDKSKERCLETNFHASIRLAEASRLNGVRTFIFASTCSVYGDNSESLLDEESSLGPSSLYARTKLDAEKALKDKDGLDLKLLRFATLCGPSRRMRFDLVLNSLVASSYNNGEMSIYGGDQMRPLFDVRDASKAITHLVEHPSSIEQDIVNVGSTKQNITIKDLGKKVLKLIPGTKIDWNPMIFKDTSYQVSFTRLEKAGFVPEFGLDDSIRAVKAMFDEKIISDYTMKRYYNA